MTSESNLILVNQQRLKVIAAFAALYLVWGSTYVAILFALKTIPPFLLAGVRFLLAGLILYAWCCGKKQTVPSAIDVVKISFAGVLLLVFGTGAVIWVEQYLSSGLTAIIWSTLPFWFVLLDRRLWKFHFSNKSILVGLLVGFTGVLMLFAGKDLFSASGNRMGLISFFILTGGAIVWVIGSLYAKYTNTKGTSTMKASLQMIAAGLFSLLISLISGEYNHINLSALSAESIGGLTYLITMGSLVAYLAYIWLLTIKPPSLVGTFAYVNPAVAVFLGWLIAHETISTLQIIALCVILSGVLLVNLSKEKLINHDSKNVAR
jgi:drug/metabolite transporter (DMT)-like permease